jgi:hypothetical protein
MKYKRFLVFQYHLYYPGGGFNDFTQQFDTLGEVKQYLIESYECSRGWNPCGKCRHHTERVVYDKMHQWGDVNKVVDLIGDEDLDGNWFIENYKSMKDELES